MIRGWRLNGSIVQSSVYRDSSAPFGMSERSSVRMGTQVFLAVSSHLPTSIWLSAIGHRMISLQLGGSSPWCQRNTRNCLSIAPTMPHPTSAAAGGVRQTGRVYSSTPNQALGCPATRVSLPISRNARETSEGTHHVHVPKLVRRIQLAMLVGLLQTRKAVPPRVIGSAFTFLRLRTRPLVW